MKKNVSPVIAGWVQPPEGSFDSEAGVGERKILRRGIEGEPNSAQTIWRSQQFVIRNISIVIPKEAAIPSRPVGHNCGSRQAEDEQRRQHTEIRPPLSYTPHIILGKDGITLPCPLSGPA